MLAYNSRSHSPSLGEVRAGTQIGTEAGPIEDIAHWLIQLAFLYSSDPTT